MNHEHFFTYLNDHLAGSSGALELIERLHDGTSDPTLIELMRTLQHEIGAEQEILRDLINRSGQQESTLKQAGAWLMEKVSALKLGHDGDAEAPMRLFLALETLSLGIRRKEALWRTLAYHFSLEPLFADMDFDALVAQSKRQFDRVEERRLVVADQALSSAADKA